MREFSYQMKLLFSLLFDVFLPIAGLVEDDDDEEDSIDRVEHEDEEDDDEDDLIDSVEYEDEGDLTDRVEHEDEKDDDDESSIITKSFDAIVKYFLEILWKYV